MQCFVCICMSLLGRRFKDVLQLDSNVEAMPYDVNNFAVRKRENK